MWQCACHDFKNCLFLMRMIYVDLGLHYPSLDGTHIQTETSEEQDPGQDKEIESGIDLFQSWIFIIS